MQNFLFKIPKQRTSTLLTRPFQIRRFFCTKTKELTHYQQLGLTKSASKKEIKSKYKKLVKKYHPDIYKGSDTSRFQAIQEAYSTLVSPRKRAAYDEEQLNKERPSDFSGDQNRSGKGDSVDWGDIDDEYKQNKTSTDFYDDFQKGVKSNNFNEDTLKEEFDKFSSQKNTTEFGSVDVRENQYIRGLSEKDRKKQEWIARRRMTFKEQVVFDNHTNQSFDDLIDETIDLQNQNTTGKKWHRANEAGKAQARFAGYLKIFGIFLGFGLLGCMTLMFDLKLTDLEREEKMDELKVESVRNIQRLSTQSRMVFDHDDE